MNAARHLNSQSEVRQQVAARSVRALQSDGTWPNARRVESASGGLESPKRGVAIAEKLGGSRTRSASNAERTLRLVLAILGFARRRAFQGQSGMDTPIASASTATRHSKRSSADQESIARGNAVMMETGSRRKNGSSRYTRSVASVVDQRSPPSKSKRLFVQRRAAWNSIG